MSRGGLARLLRLSSVSLLVCSAVVPAWSQQSVDPFKLLAEADRLAWLRVWPRAEPLYGRARQTFIARGDRRNALYAEVNQLRGQLPRLAVPDVSERLAAYLDDPVVRDDDRLRLRVLAIKGETDADFDPALSRRSWTEALALAEKLADAGWVNRARAELGLASFLLGDTNTAIVNLGQALKVAEASGDASSLVRWLTLFGHGFVELRRPEQALDYYDRALKVAAGIPELQTPVMTYLGKADALMRLDRASEAQSLLARALEAARAEGSLGYQAELTLRLALLEAGNGQTSAALQTMARASDLARAAGGNRILAGIALEQARLLRTASRASEAEATLVEGIRASRSMGERLILPQLLSQLADLRLARGQRGPAAALIGEADDILEGLLTNASSPWARGRIMSAMDGVVATRIRLEGSASPANPAGLLAAVERARARSLLELLYSRPPSDVRLPVGVRDAERRIAALQLRLLRATAREERARLLAQIFAAEERLAPLSTELFTRAQRSARSPVGLGRIQAALRTDELFYEIALTEPASFGLVITTGAARVKQLPGRAAILAQADALASAARDGRDITEPAERMADTLLSAIPELTVRRRLILSLEGSLERMPFELLPATRGRRLLDTHVVSYTPSGSVLVLLRARPGTPLGERSVLAIGASPDRSEASEPSAKAIATAGNVFDVDASRLPQLPLATEEARQVGALFVAADSVVLVNADATEAAVKAQPLASFRVVHFAAHGIVSTKDPARSAVLLKPSGQDDGLLQAREVLNLRFSAALVTLSACDTSAGAQLGQDGVASLVRPFLAAGARAVVANLWSVDDTFSAALMKQFYGHLTKGKDIGEALRLAKLAMLDQFGPAATPQLWSGVLAYGDAAQRIVDRGTGAGANGAHR